MVVHPAPGNETGTLVNGLLFHCKNGLSGINGVIRPGIVHRIDKETALRAALTFDRIMDYFLATDEKAAHTTYTTLKNIKYVG